MRRDFHPLLLDHMQRDPRIWLITPDLGYKMLDQCFTKFPDRCFNVGAAEQLALGVAVGLADEGKIPVVYSITPFLLKRPFEWIDNYLEHESANVKLLVAGRYENGKECYDRDGYTHHAKGDKQILDCWPHIRQFWPDTEEDLVEDAAEWLSHKGPAFLSLRR